MTPIQEDPMFAPARVAKGYAGTTGSAGSEASRERAEREAENGTTESSQRTIIGALRQAGMSGLTVVDLRNDTTLHHGQVAGNLSNLHKDGQIVALIEKRDGCGIYVLPEHVLGRRTRPFRPNKTMTPAEQELFDGFVSAVQLGGERGIQLRQPTGRALITLIRRLSA